MATGMILQIAEKELDTLKVFLRTVKDERDAIISFSLEGIIRENNRKEEILKKLEYLEAEKEKLLKETTDGDLTFSTPEWAAVQEEVDRTMKDVRTALEKNMKLLSFSMDHVRTTIEKILGFISKTTYGKPRESISLFPARKA